MPFRFTGNRIRFWEGMRHVIVSAERDGVPVSVLIPSAVIEHVAAARKLSKDASFTAVVRNKILLAEAAERAFRRHEVGSTLITVEMMDMNSTAPKVANGLR
jgi:hypothetical protein